VCAEKGVDIDFQAPHHEFNGAAMVAQKIHQSITKQRKKGKNANTTSKIYDHEGGYEPALS
jgi:hypothetical protein